MGGTRQLLPRATVSGWPAGIFSGRGLLGSSVMIRAALPGELAEVGELRVAAYRAVRRLPARDWQPSPDMQLLAYGLVLYGRQ
jgi:hypothetical protein